MPGRNSKRMNTKQARHQVDRSSRVSKEDDVDIKTPMFPLDHYVGDRSELMDQMFVSLSKGSHLQISLPDILKDLPTDELKRLCLGQLEVMSKKRIRKILAGVEMESSSGTDDSDENEAISKPTDDSGLVIENAPEPMDGCQQPADSTVLEGQLSVESPKGSERLSAGGGGDDVDAGAAADVDMQMNDRGRPPSWSGEANSDVMLELHPGSVYGSPGDVPRSSSMADEDSDEPEMEAEQSSPGPEAVVSAPPEAAPGAVASNDRSVAGMSGDPSASIAKTCMEIFELELRARAIKSLLKTQSSESKSEGD